MLLSLMVVSILRSRQERCMLTMTLSVSFRGHTPVEVVEHAVSNLALIKVHTYRFPIIDVGQINAFSCTSVVQLRLD